jgi:hypothetical protein
MTDQAYYLQKAVHTVLTASPGLVALVPAENIADIGGLPSVFPSIVIGEAQIVDEGQRVDRSVVRVYLTCHIWTREPHLNHVKKVGGAIRLAVEAARPTMQGGYRLGDLRIENVQYLRDPGGENGHGVVTLNAIVVTV